MRLVLVALVLATTAQARPLVALKMNLVPAQCEGAPPGPCSAATFTKGSVDLRTARQPAPVCPKTGQTTENVAGVVAMSGVTRDGAAYTGTLSVDVQYKTTFGADPNGNCSLAGVQLTVVSIQGEVACKSGRCKGNLFQIACLERNCANVRITSELAACTVYDAPATDLQRKALAVPGTVIVPQADDAP